MACSLGTLFGDISKDEKMSREALISANVTFESLFANCVHIWFLDTDVFAMDTTFLHYGEILSRDEFKTYSQFLFDRDKHRYLLTRLLVRSCLSHYFPVTNLADWRFSKNRYGRPSIAFPCVTDSFNFNISHSGKFVVCAVSACEKLGVDLESHDNNRQCVDISRRFFSAIEYESLVDLSPVEQRKRFLRLWTLKEAFAKAEGLGLAMDLRSFWFLISNEKIGFRHTAELPATSDSYYFGQGAFSSSSFDSKYDFAIAIGKTRIWERAPQFSLVNFSAANNPCVENFHLQFSNITGNEQQMAG